MKVKEGDEIIFNGRWWIVQEIFTAYDGVANYDECAIVDEDGDEKIIFCRQIDTVLTNR